MATSAPSRLNPAAGPPLLSVVIPTYNGRALLDRCLASLARHEPRVVPLEVIVVDDASSDGTAAWLAAEQPAARLVARARNGGYAAAVNDGIAAARGAFVQVLNNDTEVSAGWAEAGLAPFADPLVAAVAPLVLVHGEPGRVDSAGDVYTFLGWPAKRGHGDRAEAWTSTRPGRVFGASGSSAIFRADVLRQVGAFDPLYGAYYEDVDLAFRLRWAGYECVFAPDCRILHQISASYQHARPDLQRQIARNAELLFWSNLPIPWLVLALPARLGFLGIQAAHRALGGRLRPFVDGKLDAIRARQAISDRRRLRRELARQAVRRPHFPIEWRVLGQVRRHLTRPGKPVP